VRGLGISLSRNYRPGVYRIKTGAVLLAIVAGAWVCWAAPVAPDAATPAGCRTLRLHGKKAEATACYEALSRSGDAYSMAEGFWGLAQLGLAQYDQANEEFRIATGAPGAKALYKVRWGMLLHERFNNPDAVGLFNEALAKDPRNAQAYLGLAMVSADGFDGKASEYAAKAIAADPKLVEAYELMANLALEDAKPDDAVKEADKSLELSAAANGGVPDALDAMAVRAAADLLADKDADAEAWLGKIRAVNPGYGEGYAIVARHLVLNRRYEEGVAYYRKAVEVDPLLWPARSELGISLMRLGQEDEPREQLELCYNNGYRDKATVNSLRLLDSYKNFVTTKDETTILRLRKNEADLLRPYFEEELHKAIATYSAKYKMNLSGPVQLEVYPDHEDFAVRTMGMPGLGALGVTFGNVVAMDSPSGRKPGEFNWGATLWHEMSHVFILSATNFRVPRWFTEGLAVHEEGQANPEWANRLTPEVVAAIRDKKLLPVAEMDRGFIFPEYPEQVLVSYYQAGTICDYISEHWGDDALLGMVHSFAELKSTPEAIEANLHVSPEEFDKQYATWLDKRVGHTVANFDAWRAQLKALVGMSQKNDDDRVIVAAAAVIKMYPEYVEDANAYEILANAQLVKGNKQVAADALKLYELLGGENPKTLEKLASLEEELGHVKEAAATLEHLNFIYPEDADLHRKLGGLWLAQGNDAGAVREYNAVVAMKPLDVASAEFDVARAYMAEGDKAKAEESVLASLEAAPGYKPAQKLLLEIEAAVKTGP
jgi:cellulose synthase operon protein C